MNVYIWITSLASFITVLVHASGPSLDPTRISLATTSGLTALLPCSAKNLDENPSVRVVWMDPSNKILSYNQQIVTTDKRFTIRRPYPNDWNLLIENVKYSDRGEYKCQLTTTPRQTRTVQVTVNVSPKIAVHPNATDYRIKEYDKLTLQCNVTGVPKPTITWFKKTKEEPNVKDNLGRGDILTVSNITRKDAGIYECSASNNIPPPATKQIHVNVEFPPNVSSTTNRIIQSRGKNTVLECTVSAFPMMNKTWIFNGREILKTTSWKYKRHDFQVDERTASLNLEIFGLEKNDFGEYTCYAQNKLGSARQIVILEESRVTVPPAPTTTTTSIRTTTTSTEPTTTVTSSQPEDTMTTTKTSAAQKVTSSNQILTTRSHGNVVIENGNDTSNDLGYSVEDSNILGKGSMSQAIPLTYTVVTLLWSSIVIFLL